MLTTVLREQGKVGIWETVLEHRYFLDINSFSSLEISSIRFLETGSGN